MNELTRRKLLAGAGVAAGGAAVASAVRALPADAGSGDRIIGYVYDEGGQVFDVKAYGAKGDTVMVSGGGSISSGSTTLTWSAGGFVAGDATKTVTVQGAGASGTVLVAKISTVTSATTVTLDTAASTTVSAHDFSYGTDDTTAIGNAITAAGSAGVVFAPPGIYTITGQVAIGSGLNAPHVGLVGGGGRCIPDATAASTVFLCANGAAGVLANGWAIFQGFLVHGNHIATAPLVQGVLGGGAAINSASYSTFIDVWSTAAYDDGTNEAGNGWNVYGPQNDSYWDCGTTNNDADGLYIDAGAGGLDFWRFHESGSGQYGVHGDTKHDAAGGYTSFTGNVHFFGGELISDATTQLGVSKIYNRGGQDWKFLDMTIRGDNLSGPTVDLDQNSNVNGTYGIDLSGSTISATPTPGGANPGRACIQIAHPGSSNTAYTYAKMDRVRFLAGDTSVYLEANNGYYRYSAREWVADNTTNGPVGGTGIAIDTLLEGRTGAWQTAVLGAHWSGTVEYRYRADGLIELKGNAAAATGAGTTIFSLNAGYRPNGGSGATMRIAVSRSDGVNYVTITPSSGAVVTTAVANGLVVYFDGVSFTTD